MNYKHITIEERKLIAKYLNEGKTKAEISRRLNRSRATINREIERNITENGYKASAAQNNYNKRKKLCAPKNKLETNEKLYNLVIKGLKMHLFPEQIHKTLCKEISTSTIYRAIKNKIIPEKYTQKTKY